MYRKRIALRRRCAFGVHPEEDVWTLLRNAFTNARPTHQRVWSQRYAEVLSLFDNVFVSSDLGKRKPEPEAFLTIATALGVALPRIVSCGDLLENVEGARAVGMQAVHVRSLADIADSLGEILG